jgi:hypothetical protein
MLVRLVNECELSIAITDKVAVVIASHLHIIDVVDLLRPLVFARFRDRGWIGLDMWGECNGFLCRLQRRVGVWAGWIEWVRGLGV